MTQLNFISKNNNRLNWKEIVKERQNYLCANASLDPLRDHTKDLNVHHILPKYLGGKDEPNNGIYLCRNCHAAMHSEFEQKFFSLNIKYFSIYVRDFFASLIGLPTVFKYYKALELLTGKKSFRSIQESVIRTIIENNSSVLVVMPTGAGKSILYQIPGLLTPGQSLVISPLISLMIDQVKNLQRRWIPCTYINSTLEKLKNKNGLISCYRTDISLFLPMQSSF